MNMPRFVDSFYFIALLNPKDEHHARVMEATRRFAGPHVTTSLVLTEVADALCGSPLRPLTHRMLVQVHDDSNIDVVTPDHALFRSGIALYGARPDKSWSLTDCISFVVMSERGITEALTGDHHFEQAGFRALLSQT